MRIRYMRAGPEAAAAVGRTLASVAEAEAEAGYIVVEAAEVLRKSKRFVVEAEEGGQVCWAVRKALTCMTKGCWCQTCQETRMGHVGEQMAGMETALVSGVVVAVEGVKVHGYAEVCTAAEVAEEATTGSELEVVQVGWTGHEGSSMRAPN